MNGKLAKSIGWLTTICVQNQGRVWRREGFEQVEPARNYYTSGSDLREEVKGTLKVDLC
jgi:hypothetical protein